MASVSLLPMCPLSNLADSSASASQAHGADNNMDDGNTENALGAIKKQDTLESNAWGTDDCKWYPLEGTIKVGESLRSDCVGEVYAGWYNGRPAEFKLCPALAPLETIDAMNNEVFLYEELVELQGVAIPLLYAAGLLAIGGQIYLTLVLELLGDNISNTNSDRATAIQEQLSLRKRCLVMAKLQLLHDHRICHGDPRAENVKFVCNPNTGALLEPRFVNFAYVFSEASDDDMVDDLTGWGEVLGAQVFCVGPFTKRLVV